MVSRGGHQEAWERRRRTASTAVDLADRVALVLSPDDAWRRLNDVEAVAACIPGLVPGSLERIGEHEFRGKLRKTALGVPAAWSLKADLQPSEGDRRLAVRLEGEEPRLGLRLSGWATLAVGAGTATPSDLDYRAHVEITGRLAGAGGPVIRDVVDNIVRRFVATVGEVPAAAPRGVLGRLFDRLAGAVRRLFGLRADRGGGSSARP